MFPDSTAAGRNTALMALLFGTIGLILIAVVIAQPSSKTVSPAISTASDLDLELRNALTIANMHALEAPAAGDPAQIALGESLFFDPALSGNRDISCATCHHPAANSGDGQPLSIGTGGEGIGMHRIMGNSDLTAPRNAPELFNRGVEGWHTMFWDGRIERLPDGSVKSPAKSDLPEGLDNLLAVQALFPITSRVEMRGETGESELGNIHDEDFPAIWSAVTERVVSIPAYAPLFEAAYPEKSLEDITIVEIANAIAAYEIHAFTRIDTPFNAYLEGDNLALTEAEKRGALLFYGKAECSTCHTGPLMTDQNYHNISVPHIGPGKEGVLDQGRVLIDESAVAFSFRTPSLHNVALTAPYMHNGAYSTLEEVLNHHLTPEEMCLAYDGAGLPSHIDVDSSDSTIQLIAADVSPLIRPKHDLSEGEIDDLLAFLNALTDPSAESMIYLVPATVPSGLTVE